MTTFDIMWGLVTPEIWVTVMTCIVLLVGVFQPVASRVPFYMTQATLLVAMGLTLLVGLTHSASEYVILNGMFVFDLLALILKEFILIAALFSFWYSRQYNDERRMPNNEFFVLGLLSVLGMMVVVSAHHLVTLFLGIELLALPTYVMVAIERDKGRCAEAAMKYFVIGSAATALLLYGFSMIFGATQSMDIRAIAQAAITLPTTLNWLFVVGLVFALAGIAFKMGAAPFHMWVPDIYEGAPTSVTLFVSTAPKIAAFGLAVRILVQAMPALGGYWQDMLIVIAILSMAIGNIAAIAQTNIKRMLAYSSIAHMGYLLLGLLCLTPRGYTASLFYMLSYSVMTLCAFGTLVIMSRFGVEVEDVNDLVGLNDRNPWLALMMLIVMFSFAGIPPLVGFIAKVAILEALIQVHLVWLAAVALLFAIIGSYYYLWVVKVMYFEKGVARARDEYSPNLQWAVSINGIAVLLAGVLPGIFMIMCKHAFTGWS